MLEHRNLTLRYGRERALICHAGSVFIHIWNLDYSGGNPESRTLSPESTAWSLECNTPLRRREERREEFWAWEKSPSNAVGIAVFGRLKVATRNCFVLASVVMAILAILVFRLLWHCDHIIIEMLELLNDCRCCTLLVSIVSVMLNQRHWVELIFPSHPLATGIEPSAHSPLSFWKLHHFLWSTASIRGWALSFSPLGLLSRHFLHFPN